MTINSIENNQLPTDSNLHRSQSIVSEKLSPFAKRILIVDDDPDITLTFKKGLEAENEKSSKIFFKVELCNNPLQALSGFKPDYYDLILIDINMPIMDGIELSNKILELDVNVKICLVTAGEANVEVLRELYPLRSIGCFIKKPVTIDYLVSRIKAELD
jgi:DNA-binding response OmpR family regulator